MSEKTDQLPHAPTEKELKAVQKFEEEQERQRRRGGWVSDYGKPVIPQWEWVPNGLLVLEIDRGQHWDGLRRKFADGKRQKLETMIGTVLTAMATCAANKKQKREEAERQRIEWEEREKRRHEWERQQRLQDKRLEFLELLMKSSEKARRMEAFIDGYLARYPLESLSELGQLWIEWVRRHVDLAYKGIEPDQIAIKLKKYGLDDDATDISSWVKIE